jgi:hypothetical protein
MESILQYMTLFVFCVYIALISPKKKFNHLRENYLKIEVSLSCFELTQMSDFNSNILTKNCYAINSIFKKVNSIYLGIK